MTDDNPLAALQAARDVMACVVELRGALVVARPYVFNQTGGEDIRAEMAQEVLKRVDAALAKSR